MEAAYVFFPFTEIQTFLYCLPVTTILRQTIPHKCFNGNKICSKGTSSVKLPSNLHSEHRRSPISTTNITAAYLYG